MRRVCMRVLCVCVRCVCARACVVCVCVVCGHACAWVQVCVRGCAQERVSGVLCDESICMGQGDNRTQDKMCVLTSQIRS